MNAVHALTLGHGSLCTVRKKQLREYGEGSICRSRRLHDTPPGLTYIRPAHTGANVALFWGEIELKIP